MEEEVLTTVLTEVQLILNSRPLCAVLIPMNTNLWPPATCYWRELSTLCHLVLLWRKTFGKKEVETDRFLADNFWKRWLKEYIPALQERQKWQKTKCRDWRPCTTCRGVVGKGAVAHGSNRLNSSQQRWACGNGWSEDWSANIISATHSETFFIRRVGKPLPRLRHSV